MQRAEKRRSCRALRPLPPRTLEHAVRGIHRVCAQEPQRLQSSLREDALRAASSAMARLKKAQLRA